MLESTHVLNNTIIGIQGFFIIIFNEIENRSNN